MVITKSRVGGLTNEDGYIKMMDMGIDYLHIFDCYSHKLKYKDGRQQNYIDYSQFFIKKYPEINNCLLVEHMERSRFEDVVEFFRTNDLRDLTINYKFKTIDNFECNDVLICDFVVLLFLIEYDIPFGEYKKIIIFDCLELTVYFKSLNIPVGVHPDFRKSEKSMSFLADNKEKITFLVTPYNIQDVQGYNYIEYYKKINYNLFKPEVINKKREDGLIYYYSIANNKSKLNEGLLNSIKEKYPDVIFTNNFKDLFGYKNILYSSKPYGDYLEQFGRQIFELKYFGYNIIIDQSFQSEDKTGLDYYLEYEGDLNIMNEDFMEIIERVVCV